MKIKIPKYLRIYHIIYLIVLVVFLIFAVSSSDDNSFTEGELCRFSDGWTLEDGTPVDLDMTQAEEYNGHLTVYNRLPDKIAYNDELCFTSTNANITVCIENKVVYEFVAKENMTGKGYGTLYHTVNLDPENSSQLVSIDIDSVFDHDRGGNVSNVIVCSAPVYRSIAINRQLFPFLLSIFISFSGLVIIILRFAVNRKNFGAFNLFSLGFSLILVGLWCIGDTGIPQVTTRHYVIWRIFDYLLLPFAACQLITFLISLMKIKKSIFNHLTFIIPLLYLAIMIGGRYLFDIDMTRMTGVVYAANIMTIVLMLAILGTNEVYCRRNNISSNMMGFYIGVGLLCAGIITDTNGL